MGFAEGSLVTDLDWMVNVLVPVVTNPVTVSIATSALYDLIKYPLLKLKNLIKPQEDSLPPSPQSDPLLNVLLPQLADLTRVAYSATGRGVVTTTIIYEDVEWNISATINQQTQQTVLEANQLHARFTTRLTGSIVGVNYLDRTVCVVYEQFPEQPMWCDIGGMETSSIMPYLPPQGSKSGPIVGFEVELMWRRGSFNIFPPESIRILQFVPANELLNPDYNNPNEQRRTPTMKMHDNLTPDESNFLRWFAWADRHWSDPNLDGMINYLVTKNDKVVPHLDRRELRRLILDLIERGILVWARNQSARGLTSQAIRLNCSHPAVVKNSGVMLQHHTRY